MLVGPAIALLSSFAPLAPPVAQDDAASLRAQARQILEDGGYQQELPGTREDRERARIESDFGWGFSISPVVVLVLVGGALLLLIGLGMARRSGLASSVRLAAVPQSLPLETAAATAEIDPDALAAQGRFAEAIHALLLRALSEVARRSGGLGRGVTSREALPRVKDPAARAALAELVAAVERHEFAAREVDVEDFNRCRAAATLLLAPRRAA